MRNYYNDDLKRVGWAKQRTYRQVSSGKEDMTNKRWRVLRYIVQDFKKRKVEQVRILDTDDNTIYITPAKHYQKALDGMSRKDKWVYVHLDHFNTLNYVRKSY